MKREISERRYRNQKQLDTKKQPETRADGAEKSISDTQMVGLRPLLHHQYPPPRWYHRMPPLNIFKLPAPTPCCCSSRPDLAATGEKLPAISRQTNSRYRQKIGRGYGLRYVNYYMLYARFRTLLGIKLCFQSLIRQLSIT